MSKGRVLVVDDEADVRKSVRLILSKAGYDVVEAEDGEAGVRAIKHGDNPIALGAIICDLNMPKMSGMEAITYFRSCFPHASVIVLSGEVTSERAGLLLVQGVSSILSKPIDQDTLLAVVKKAFDGRGERTMLRHDGNS
ncbi:MAG TPA: response regulator [Nitrospiraceae bacterium]|nr:response regulator [Nitrospiraceae bacterium]